MPRRTNNSLSSVAAEDILQLTMDSLLPSNSSASPSRVVGLSSTPTVPISQSSSPISSQQPSEFLPVSSVASAPGLSPSSSWTSVSRQAFGPQFRLRYRLQCRCCPRAWAFFLPYRQFRGHCRSLSRPISLSNVWIKGFLPRSLPL